MAAEASRSVPPADCYIGSLINLISKFEIRYEGILFYINPEEASIGLGNGSSLDLFQYRASLLLVRSFGTEGRKKDGPQVPPNEKIYEYILFRGSDIKDLHVKSMAPALEEYINKDLAIIQSHCSPMEPASNSSGRGTISNQSSQEALLGNSRFTVQGGLQHNQSEKNLKSWGSALCVPNSFGPEIPFHLPKFSSPISGISFLQQPSSLLSSQGLSIPCSLPQYEQSFNVNSLFPAKALTLHESTSSIPLSVSTTTSVSSFVQHPNLNSLVATTPLYFSELFSSPSHPAICTPSLIATSLAATVEPTRVGSLNTESLLNLLPTRLLVNSNFTTAFGLNKLLVPPLGSLNNPRPSLSVNNTFIPCTEQPPPIPVQMISQSFPSIISFSSSTQGETLLPIVNSSQQKHPNSSTVHLSQPLQTLHEDTKFKVLEQKIKIESKILTPELQPPTTSMKEPLLPLPEPSHRRFNEGTFYAYHHSTGRQGRGRGYVFSEPVSRFTQDFDFTAMNEKFNKEEVWGHLGKGKGIAKYDKEGQWPSYTGKIPEDHEESLHLEIKPVYHKDDFFDQLSYNERKPSCSESENAKFSGQLKEAKNCGDSRRHRSNRGKGGRGSRKAGRLRGSGSGSGYG